MGVDDVNNDNNIYVYLFALVQSSVTNVYYINIECILFICWTGCRRLVVAFRRLWPKMLKRENKKMSLSAKFRRTPSPRRDVALGVKNRLWWSASQTRDTKKAEAALRFNENLQKQIKKKKNKPTDNMKLLSTSKTRKIIHIRKKKLITCKRLLIKNCILRSL